MKDKYEKIGYKILKRLNQSFKDSYFDKDLNENVYRKLILPLELSLAFREWGDKPFYIILFKRDKYIFELDLSRLVFNNEEYTLFLNKPTNIENQTTLSKNYTWVGEIDQEYISQVRDIKNALNSGTKLSKGGFRFCDHDNLDTFIDKIEDLITLIISGHSEANNDHDDIFDIDSPEAIEGYEIDKIITSRKRYTKISEERKIRDNNTCQACGFHLKINNNYVIDCHHLHPLSLGERTTLINDLVCLCPTCHRIAHLKQEPYTINQIKSLLNKT